MGNTCNLPVEPARQDWNSDMSDGLVMPEPSRCCTSARRAKNACVHSLYEAVARCGGCRGYEDDMSEYDIDDDRKRGIDQWVGGVTSAATLRRAEGVPPSTPTMRVVETPPGGHLRSPSGSPRGDLAGASPTTASPCSACTVSSPDSGGERRGSTRSAYEIGISAEEALLLTIWVQYPLLHVEAHPLDPPYPLGTELPIRNPRGDGDLLQDYERYPMSLTSRAQLACLQSSFAKEETPCSNPLCTPLSRMIDYTRVDTPKILLERDNSRASSGVLPSSVDEHFITARTHTDRSLQWALQRPSVISTTHIAAELERSQQRKGDAADKDVANLVDLEVVDAFAADSTPETY